MKKYLIIFLMLFLVLFIGCGEDTPDEPSEEIKEVEAIEAEHIYNVEGDEISPYIMVQSILDEEKNLIYSITYVSAFLKSIKENDETIDITARFYDYYQVDYKTLSGTLYKYFHQYDYIDSKERFYAQNFEPNYNFKEQLDNLKVLVKYRFDKLGKTFNKEIKFEEEIIKFDINEFNVNNLGNIDVRLNKIKNENEDFNRYKLSINLDDSITLGHYDIQTWIEIDGDVYPFVGFYHYRPNHGDIHTESDIKINEKYIISKIYYKIVYYSNENEIKNVYYVSEN